ncbi:MAG: hypothetical protein FD153_155 [Rhodospirillaceae bacterium]|nr:MAG: hypothetical protein FD153_155 [Rhodospirillaceae bacterium]
MCRWCRNGIDSRYQLEHNAQREQAPHAKRLQILGLLCEGSSLRSVSRVVDVSVNTVTKVLVDVVERRARPTVMSTLRSVVVNRIQCDEIWALCYAKQGSVADAEGRTGWCGRRVGLDSLGSLEQVAGDLSRRRSQW